VLAPAGVGVLPVAVARAEGEPCPNEALRGEDHSLRLPDCRGYEMVTPPYKEGYGLYVWGYSTDGERVFLESFANLAGTPGEGLSVPNSVMYMDERTAGGWVLSPLNPAEGEYVGQIPIAAEADDGETLWSQHTPEQSGLVRELYIRSATGEFSLVGPLNPPLADESEPSEYIEASTHQYAAPVAATSNYDHVVLSAQQHEDYWPFDGTVREPSLYEYSGLGNKSPILVGVEGEEKGSERLVGKCGTWLGGIGSAYNALSQDGETIFFTPVPCRSEPPLTAGVYARLHGSVHSPGVAETVDVSASECTQECGTEESGKNFEGASESGERVFFTSTQKLTNNAVNAVSAGDAANVQKEGCPAIGGQGCNLYEYDFAAPLHEQLRTVSEGGEVLGVAGIAEDGARVYFVSRAAIVSAGENPEKVPAKAGEANLYVYDALTGKTAFVATLGHSDESDWRRSFPKSVQVTGEDGRFVLFLSAKAGLTPDDTNRNGQMQLFEYAAQTASQPAALVRVTKGENGFAESGNGVSVGVSPESLEDPMLQLGRAEDFKTTTNKLNISRDGRTVIFETAGQLSPYAGSAASGCTSVYEFDASKDFTSGEVHLLSDGADTAPHAEMCGAQLDAVDGSGANVLFSTADPLVPGDVDGSERDIYDARVDGGLAVPAGAACSALECGSASRVVPELPQAGGGSSLLQAPEAEVAAPSASPVTSTVPVAKKPARAKKAHARLIAALKRCARRRGRARRRCEASARRVYSSKSGARATVRRTRTRRAAR